MAFAVNIARPSGSAKPKGATLGLKRFGLTLLVFFGIFCAFDYSPYGTGVVAVKLQAAQFAFQAFMNSFRVRF